MKVGITGTSDGATKAQREELRKLFIRLTIDQLHHGDCIGVDTEAVAIAIELGIFIVSHPPLDPKARAYAPYDVEHKPRSYLTRNKRIVHASELMIGVPRQRKEILRSGTWATIRYAVKVRKPIIIIYPDGSVEERRN